VSSGDEQSPYFKHRVFTPLFCPFFIVDSPNPGSHTIANTIANTILQVGL